MMKTLVMGIGKGGWSIVSNCKKTLDSDFLAVDTDKIDLEYTSIECKLQIGEGYDSLGAGGDLEVGKKAAESSREKIREAVQGYEKVYLVAGLGGGTGTGATPIIADVCTKMADEVKAFVTFPFKKEGKGRKKKADKGIKKIKERCFVEVYFLDNLLTEVQDVSLRTYFRIMSERIAKDISSPRRKR